LGDVGNGSLIRDRHPVLQRPDLFAGSDPSRSRRRTGGWVRGPAGSIALKRNEDRSRNRTSIVVVDLQRFRQSTGRGVSKNSARLHRVGVAGESGGGDRVRRSPV